MHRAGVLSVLALGTWSLVGCQILVRQDGTPGVNATRHATADAAAVRDAQFAARRHQIATFVELREVIPADQLTSLHERGRGRCHEGDASGNASGQ